MTETEKPALASKQAQASIAEKFPQTLQHKKGDVFPTPEYEGRHRYDPSAEWTEKEEKTLVRKLDYRICSWVCLTDGMLNDLGLSRNQYNCGQMIFYLCFLGAEVPSQMISEKLGPDVWIPIQMMTWSLFGIFQCLISGKKSFYATRVLLGLVEGGFILDALLYLSYFYMNRELPMRVGFFYCASHFTYIVAAFLAFGILHMLSVGGWEGWRWLFALEGALTMLVDFISWFHLPPGPTQTASWFRGRDGWFNEREEVIMVNRVLRDDSDKLLWVSLTNYDLWPLYAISWTMLIPTNPVSAYLTLNLKSLGFDTFETNLLTIPAYVLFLIQLVFWFCGILFLWCLSLLLALELMPSSVSPWSWYAVTVLLIGFPYIHSINSNLTSHNAGTVRTRTSTSLHSRNQLTGIQIYREDDKPYYRRGNKVLLALVAWDVVMTVFIKWYYVWRNKSRGRIWDAMSSEKDHYLKTTKDEGNKRLDFRFAH
ncbi:major facilitator superfamily domain-containing protein [Aspergillus falconensis]